MDKGPRIRIHIKILRIRNTASYETFNGDTITLPTTDDNCYFTQCLVMNSVVIVTFIQG
jgi:hypothetical protein